jgi:phosphotransferase system  glucose/maltose/N-acetylglucosamine-specific IIC component
MIILIFLLILGFFMGVHMHTLNQRELIHISGGIIDIVVDLGLPPLAPVYYYPPAPVQTVITPVYDQYGYYAGHYVDEYCYQCTNGYYMPSYYIPHQY